MGAGVRAVIEQATRGDIEQVSGNWKIVGNKKLCVYVVKWEGVILRELGLL